MEIDFRRIRGGFEMKPICLAAAVAAAVMGIPCGAAQASVALTGDLTADDFFFAYLSTSPGTLGTLLTSGSNWQQTYSFSSAPLAAGTYYLNVVAQNWTGEAGFVGSFSVGGQNFDTSTAWKTAYVPNAWSLDYLLNVPGQPNWSAPTGAAFNLGTTLAAYWGAFYPSDYTSIDSKAQWIWGSDGSSFADKTEQFYQGVGYYAGVCNTCTVEFQTSFTVNSTGGALVPVPGPIAGAGIPALLGLLGFGLYRRRNAVSV